MLTPGQRKLFNTIQKLIRRDAKKHLSNLMRKIHPTEIALLLPFFDDSEREIIFKALPDAEMTAELLREADPDTGADLLQTVDEDTVQEILHKMWPDDVAEIVSGMPIGVADKVLKLMKEEDAEDVEELLQYEDDTAGRIMVPDYFALRENVTVAGAIKAVRSAEDAEMVFYVYVVDLEDRLVGVLSLRQLIMAQPDVRLRDIMVTNVTSVTTDMDQEQVADFVAGYNLLAVPVVDNDNKLVGIITVDDVIDIIQQENTEDLLKMVGTSGDAIVSQSIFNSAKSRLPWLFASWIGGILALQVIGAFEDALTQVVALAAFIPVIMGMGGNIGTQSSTIIVRGLATGKIDIENLWNVVFKEIRVGMILGVAYGFLLGAVARYQFTEIPKLSLIVGLAIFSAMTIAALIGSLIPMVLQRIRIDPAIATGPFVTTSVDIVGILVYFNVATAFLV